MERERAEIQINGVSKSYKHKKALNEVTLNVQEGMFGLLGNNGAGKSTLMSLITTLEEQDTGNITVNGYDAVKDKLEIRKRIGYLPQNFTIYPQLTAEEFLDHILMLNHYGNKRRRNERIHEVLEKVNLLEVKHAKVNSFSGGMLRRLGIAQAIVKDPGILIVDEPTAGLDPEERIRFRTLLYELSRQKVVILSTHIVEDISASCDQLCFLHAGEVRYTGNPAEFIAKVEGHVFERFIADREELKDMQRRDQTVISIKQTQKGTVVRYISGETNHSAMRAEPNLEDAYLYNLENLRKEHDDAV